MDMFRIKSAAYRKGQNEKKMHASGGFIKIYIFFSCLAFLIVACAYYIGKKIPSNELAISDPVADRYEVAGVDLNQNPELDPSLDPNLYYGQTYPRPQGGDPQLADTLPEQIAQQGASDPAAQARLATTSVLVFSSKINDRISFEYPATMRVQEGAVGNGITFTLRGVSGSSKTVDDDTYITYEKSQSGCFDPIRSFAIDPSMGIDYRILHPQKTFFAEEKYQAIRTDEEVGRYVDAGSDPDRSLVLVSNICVQTAIPTKMSITSGSLSARDMDYLIKIHDAILSKLTL